MDEFFTYVHKSDNDDLLRQLIKKVYTDLQGSSLNTTTYVDEKGRLVLNEPPLTVSAAVTTKSKRSRLLTVMGIAALIIVIAGLTWMINEIGNSKENTKKATLSSLTKKTTNRSESKFLLLEDSTQVWLNAASSLEFPDQFDGSKREVYLSGEAFFDVKHADKIPFIIHTGNISTTVMGTAFNIKAYPGQKNITVSVSRGKVKVSRTDGWIATLTKGQQVKVNKEGSEVTEKNIAPEGIAAWQQGNLVYEDETFEDIIADMERMYNANIRIVNNSLPGQKISTSFKREIGVEQALQVLCKLTDTELKQADGSYLIQ
jgi:ferric-dicitrate binding protein FerR (iron transport regulator)